MVNAAPSDGGGGSGGLAPYDKHPASPGAIDGEADDLGRAANQVLNHQAVTMQAFDPANANWDGLAAPELNNLPKDTLHSAEDIGGKLAWAAVPLRYWAGEVTQFNAAVDKLLDDLNNAKGSDGHWGATGDNGKPPTEGQIAAKQAEAERVAQGAWYAAYNTHIAGGSADAAGMFRDGATPDNVRKATEMGAIPGAPGAFTIFGAKWEHDAAVQAANDLRDAMDGRTDPAKARQALEYLESVVGDLKRRGQGDPMDSTDQAFLSAFYGTLGNRLLDLPGYIRANEHKWGKFSFTMDVNGHRQTINVDNTQSAPGFGKQDQDAMMAALGTGLLELSNTRYGGSWDKVPQDIKNDIHDLPQIKENSTSGGQTANISYTVEGGRGFLGLADILGGADRDVVGGREFSGAVTHAVADFADTMDKTDRGKFEWDHAGMLSKMGGTMDFSGFESRRGELNNAMQNLLNVSTRNTDANTDFLEGKPAYPGDQQHNPRTDLEHLYNYNWDDKGRAAAGLTTWIGDRSEAAHQQGHEDPQANEAAVALIKDVTGDNKQIFESIKDNPEISRSFAHVAGANLDALSASGGGTTQIDSQGHLNWNSDDRRQFLALVDRDPDAGNGLSMAAGSYEQQMLNDAMNHKPGAPGLDEAGDRTSTLDGELAAGFYNEQKQANNNHQADAMAAYRQHLYYANAGRSLVTHLVGMVPVAGSWVSYGAGQVIDGAVYHNIIPPTPAGAYDTSGLAESGYDKASQDYNYLNAQVQTGHVDLSDPGLQPFLSNDRTGHPSLRPLNEILGTDRQRLEQYLDSHEHSGLNDYGQHYTPQEKFNNATKGVDARVGK